MERGGGSINVKAERQRYQVEYTYSAKKDVREMRKYIIDKFKYREYGDAFTKKIKRGVESIKEFPKGFSRTEFRYKGYIIYLRPHQKYLILYTIDKTINMITILRVMRDGMDWRFILARWLRNENDYGDIST